VQDELEGRRVVLAVNTRPKATPQSGLVLRWVMAEPELGRLSNHLGATATGSINEVEVGFTAEHGTWVGSLNIVEKP
jgi:hypothetical protein